MDDAPQVLISQASVWRARIGQLRQRASLGVRIKRAWSTEMSDLYYFHNTKQQPNGSRVRSQDRPVHPLVSETLPFVVPVTPRRRRGRRRATGAVARSGRPSFAATSNTTDLPTSAGAQSRGKVRFESPRAAQPRAIARRVQPALISARAPTIRARVAGQPGRRE